MTLSKAIVGGIPRSPPFRRGTAKSPPQKRNIPLCLPEIPQKGVGDGETSPVNFPHLENMESMGMCPPLEGAHPRVTLLQSEST